MFFTAKQKFWNTWAISWLLYLQTVWIATTFWSCRKCENVVLQGQIPDIYNCFLFLGVFYTSLWFWKPYFTELPAYCWQYCVSVRKPCQYFTGYFQVDLLTTLRHYACSFWYSQTLKTYLVHCLSLLASCLHFSWNPSVQPSQICAFPEICMWSFSSICNHSLQPLSFVLLFLCILPGMGLALWFTGLQLQQEENMLKPL